MRRLTEYERQKPRGPSMHAIISCYFRCFIISIIASNFAKKLASRASNGFQRNCAQDPNLPHLTKTLIQHTVLFISSLFTICNVPARLLCSSSANHTVPQMKLSMSLHKLSGIPETVSLVTHKPFLHLNGN